MFKQIFNRGIKDRNALSEFPDCRVAVKAKKSAHFLGGMTMVNSRSTFSTRKINATYCALVALLAHYQEVLIGTNAELGASLTKLPHPYFIRLQVIPSAVRLTMANAMLLVKAITARLGLGASIVCACAGFAVCAKPVRLRLVFVKLFNGLCCIAGSAVFGNTGTGHDLILQNALRLWLGRCKSYLVRPFQLYHCQPFNLSSFCACVEAAPPHIFSEAAISTGRLYVSCA